MALEAGSRLGPYEILAPIGAGGMGEVFKARDTRLDRIVAIKVSKEQFSERFERDIALQLAVPCAIHLAHSARSKRCDDFIGPQASPSRKSHRMLADSIPPEIVRCRIVPGKRGSAPRSIQAMHQCQDE